MRVSDLLRAGGGLQDAAYGAKAELTRYRVSGDPRQTQLIEVDLAAMLRGDGSADLLLQPFDFLNVKEVPEWSEQEQVTLLGEVRFPGVYPIQRGETLRSVLERAGGLTALAFPSGSVFTREELQGARTAADRPAGGTPAERSGRRPRCRPPRPTRARRARRCTVGQSLLTQLQGDEGRRTPGHRSQLRCSTHRSARPTTWCCATATSS